MAEVVAPIQDRSDERQRMVAFQVAKRGVTDPRVLEAMRQVPREAFVGAGMEEFAYEDAPLPIAAGQTISQPYIVALMIEAAQIKPGDRVLDVGTGSGYGWSRVCSQPRDHHAPAAAVGERLTVGVADDEAGVGLLDGPRRREAARCHRQIQSSTHISTKIPANSHAPPASMAAKV
jgi:Protein-L-isoaspartate(D-aspartate) O-methyltransferase (PCMT)